MTTKNRNHAATLAKLDQSGVRFCLASYVDIHGRSKCKVVPVEHAAQMLNGSELFTGAALDGVPQAVNDDEVAAVPDPSSLTILPWKRDTAWFASDLWLRNAPFEACSRQILRRVLTRCHAMGFDFNLGIETEFFVLKDGADGVPVPIGPAVPLHKPAYDVRTILECMPVVQEIVESMNTLGWDVYSFDQEDAPGQFETDFKYADGLVMADRFTFFRLMVNAIAEKHGYFATFMPKPFKNRTGSGAHYNISLADRASHKNRFEDPKDPRGCGMSTLGYQFIAGVLRHARAICAVIAPTVNSYKRLIARGSMSGYTWAPIFVCYGNNNRTNMLRIPMNGPRIECRAADISCNLYLGAAMILAAGLKGIEEGLDPGEPHRENMYLRSPEELAKANVQMLPRSLGEAIEAFRIDPLSEEVMGPLMYRTFIDVKTDEWLDYQSHVTDWEMSRYLKFF
ncbi:MAG: type III glutamate--ammonia ligase [Burkholderiales bacterium]